MAQLSNVYDSYDATNINKESLADIIYGLNPAKTPLLSSAAQGKARATLHEWTSDAWVDTVGYTNAAVEGDEYSNTAITAPSRNVNYCQISNKVISVTDTEVAVDSVGAKDAMAYNIAKYGQLLKNDMETIMCGNQAASAGTNNTTEAVRKLRSFEAWVPEANRDDNVTSGAGTTTLAATDGTTGQLRAFTESQFLNVLQAMYLAGAEPDTALFHPVQKRVFAGFAGSNFKQIDGSKKTAYNMVDLYECDFGTIKAVQSRYVRPAGVTGNATPGRSVLVYESDKVEVAYLRPFTVTDLAKTGSSTRKVIETEYTFVARNPSALGVIADLSGGA